MQNTEIEIEVETGIAETAETKTVGRKCPFRTMTTKMSRHYTNEDNQDVIVDDSAEAFGRCYGEGCPYFVANSSVRSYFCERIMK